VKEEKVVDLWGFNRSNRSGLKHYDGNTLQNIYSSTKCASAMALGSLVDRGLLKYEDKISKHWPEFAKHGKQDITVA